MAGNISVSRRLEPWFAFASEQCPVSLFVCGGQGPAPTRALLTTPSNTPLPPLPRASPMHLTPTPDMNPPTWSVCPDPADHLHSFWVVSNAVACIKSVKVLPLWKILGVQKSKTSQLRCVHTAHGAKMACPSYRRLIVPPARGVCWHAARWCLWCLLLLLRGVSACRLPAIVSLETFCHR